MSYTLEVSWPEIKPLFRYAEELWTCRCLSDLHLLGVFPSVKELTESCAAYNAIRSKANTFELRDPEVTFISVGDGSTPRTAAMIAFRSAWQCISIDPKLKKTDWPVKRLACWKVKIEDYPPTHYKKLVVAAVHGHAPLDVVCERLTADKRIVIAMPCCVKQERERPPDMEYVDKAIWSPHNRIKIWKDIPQ